MTKKKIHKLNAIPEQEFWLVGIVSHTSDFSIGWAINKALRISLKRSDDHGITVEQKDVVQEFSAYYFDDLENEISYTLISNKCEAGFLLKNYKNVDFLLKLGGEISKEKLDELVSIIKKDEIVLTAFLIENLPASKKKIFL